MADPVSLDRCTCVLCDFALMVFDDVLFIRHVKHLAKGSSMHQRWDRATTYSLETLPSDRYRF